ncbi:MAG: hypothetical protein R3C59_15670 [Planctomycetaceae bacterium]
MKPFRFHHLSIFLLVTVCAVPSAAQQRTAKFPVQIEVLTQPSPNFKLHSLKWAEAFQKLSRSPVFRTGRNGETTKVEETEFRGRTGVKVIGIMNRDGSISFTGRTFISERPEPLEAWLERFEEFGAKGPPDESPTWGLSDDQFKVVLNLLAPTVTDPVDLSNPVAAIESLQLSKQFTVVFTEQAKPRRVLPAAKMGTIGLNCKGLSKGTALAVTLAQFGLGFRPLENPDGVFLIEVGVGNESDNQYPIGWKPNVPIFNVIPAIGKTIPVDLENGDLDAIIQLMAQKLEVPYCYAAYPLLIEGKDISKLKYSRKPDKLSIERLMRIVGQAHDIGLSLRTDEAGSVFLWVTTDANVDAWQQRFAHIRPAP